MSRNVFRWGFAPLALTVFIVSAAVQVGSGQQQNGGSVAIDNDDIGGVVTGAKGPEAGVWVIAETTNLPTRMIRIVVTDDQGRFVVPDLPTANYDVWVRGYGLIDSPKTQSAPGKTLNLKAVAAPNPKAAAQYYPAQYWFAMMQMPPKSDFPGTGENGNGISPMMRSQGEWIRNIVNVDGCAGCHQLGNQATREIPKMFLGGEGNGVEAWEKRILSGQAGAAMDNRFTQVGRKRALDMYADWTNRIAGGETPSATPPRPQGRERNVVVTMWDYADPKAYLHDSIASDKRNPTVNPNGPIFGATENSTEYIPVLDPKTSSTSRIPLQVRDPNTPSEADTPPAGPSPYWGDEAIWNSKSIAHSFAMDKQARVWIAARVRPNQTAAFCRQGSDHPSAQAFPINQSNRHIQMYDPKTKKVIPIDTCFGTHHLNFDNNDVLWFTGGGPVEGWFDTRIFDKTGDEKKAQGWTAFVVDTNGNGRRDAYVEPDQPLDPTKDKRVNAPFYGVAPEPNGNAIWGSVTGMPGYVVRLSLGSNPPATALSEIYEVPFQDPKASGSGFAPRGMDVDSNNVVWTTLSSGQLASFDRRKCKGPLNGPNALGKQCPEGWTFHNYPGPNYKGAVDNGSAEAAYYNFVDRFDMLGLGKDVPLATGNESDAVLALVDGKWMSLRIPYPMGFYGKGLDGRIDDPNAGWKGKGIWTTTGSRAPFHMETGRNTLAKVYKLQVRPNPLAK